MTELNLNKAEFVLSAAAEKQFIQTSMPKVAFAGKSNVGKSSVINCILNRRNMAKTGSHPGKTVHVNYFLIDGRVYFTDLPGYGFAKVSKSERDRWAKLMESYFALPDMFNLGIFIVDGRHKPTADDRTMAEFFLNSGKNFIVVANKVDKLKKSEIDPNMAMIRQELSLPGNIVVLPFSAETKFNREKLIGEIGRAI